MVKDRQFNPTVVVLATLACGDSAGAAQGNEIFALFKLYLSVKIAENLSWWGSSDSSDTDTAVVGPNHLCLFIPGSAGLMKTIQYLPHTEERYRSALSDPKVSDA